MLFTGELKPYQEEPVKKFLERGNLLVAYEMGLGKTVIGIAAAEELLASGAISCCVIVCPASLKYQWAQRIAQFTDALIIPWKIKGEEILLPLNTCIIDGGKAAREKLYKQVVPLSRYIIMGYDNVINDTNFVRDIKPGMVILDEATAIKTFKAQRTKQIKKMLKAPYRMALTGTPIENRPDEVFSIMQWVDETVLGRYDLFDKAYCKRNTYGWVIAYKNLPVLRRRLATAMSRKSRLDPDVRPFLPEVDYSEDWMVEIPPAVRKVYKTIALDMIKELDNVEVFNGFDVHAYYSGHDESTPSGKLMAMYMCLEMLLDHPDLIIHSAQNGAGYANYLWQSGMLDDILESQKLNLVVDKVAEITQFPENKVIIFSFYREMINIIQEELDVQSVQFHGDLSPADKAAAISKFANDPECRVLLSSHAGAYGADLYMANYLVNYDQPWSAGKADQINGRHVRVSSEFSQVYIRDIMAIDSVNEWKKRKVIRKRRIAGAIMDGVGQDDTGSVELDGDTLRDHLAWVIKSW